MGQGKCSLLTQHIFSSFRLLSSSAQKIRISGIGKDGTRDFPYTRRATRDISATKKEKLNPDLDRIRCNKKPGKYKKCQFVFFCILCFSALVVKLFPQKISRRRKEKKEGSRNVDLRTTRSNPSQKNHYLNYFYHNRKRKVGKYFSREIYLFRVQFVQMMRYSKKFSGWDSTNWLRGGQLSAWGNTFGLSVLLLFLFLPPVTFKQPRKKKLIWRTEGTIIHQDSFSNYLMKWEMLLSEL